MLKRTSAIAVACVLALAGCGGGHQVAKSTGPVQHAAAPSQSAMGSVAPAGWGLAPKGVALLPPPVAKGVAMREMFDTTDAGSPPVPLRAPYLAGYTAGLWPTYGPLTRLFWHPIVKSIAIGAGYYAQCLDDEPGDATPAEAGPWALAEIHHGIAHPCVYSDLSEMPAVKASLAASLGAKWRSHVFLWLAWYRYVAGLVAGYDAVQWNNHAYGLNLDESTATLAFLGITPVRVICIGAHQLNTAQCRKVRAQLAYDQGAAKSSRAAVTGTQRAIDRLLVRKAMFAGRVKYFDSAAAQLLKAWS